MTINVILTSYHKNVPIHDPSKKCDVKDAFNLHSLSDVPSQTNK